MPSTVVRARIDARTKDEASAILAASGLSVSDAFRMLLVRTVAEGTLPFEPQGRGERRAPRTVVAGDAGADVMAVVAARSGEIATLCRSFGVRRLDLFGSAATGAFHPATSDIDVLVTLDQTETGYVDAFFGLLDALEALFGRKVDLIAEHAIANPYLRRQILAERRQLYPLPDGA